MKIIKEEKEMYQVLLLEYETHDNKVGRCIGTGYSKEEALNIAEDYLKNNKITGKFIEIVPSTPGKSKPLSYEYYGPRSGKVVSSHSEIHSLDDVKKMKAKYLKESFGWPEDPRDDVNYKADYYDADHAAEWMDKHPYGWYNSESDYGTGDEEDDEEDDSLDEGRELTRHDMQDAIAEYIVKNDMNTSPMAILDMFTDNAIEQVYHNYLLKRSKTMKIKKVNEANDRIKATGDRLAAKYNKPMRKKDFIDAIIYELYNSPNTKEDLIRLLNGFRWEEISSALDQYYNYDSDKKMELLNKVRKTNESDNETDDEDEDKNGLALDYLRDKLKANDEFRKKNGFTNK